MAAEEGAGFWRLVLAEARATWWGRHRWLWIGLVALTEAAVIVDSPTHFFLFSGVPILLVLTWAPPIVCGSLLARPARGDPPERPRELLAGAVGRVLPLQLVLLIPTAHFLAIDPAPMFWEATPFVAMLWSAGWAYAATAALLSAATRRRHPWVVTALVVVYGAGVLRWRFWLDVLADNGAALRSDPIWVGFYLLIPQVGLAEEWGNGVLERLDLARTWGYPETFAVAAGLFLLIALAAGAFCWWIAARRYRAVSKPAEP